MKGIEIFDQLLGTFSMEKIVSLFLPRSEFRLKTKYYTESNCLNDIFYQIFISTVESSAD